MCCCCTAIALDCSSILLDGTCADESHAYTHTHLHFSICHAICIKFSVKTVKKQKFSEYLHCLQVIHSTIRCCVLFIFHEQKIILLNKCSAKKNGEII